MDTTPYSTPAQSSHPLIPPHPSIPRKSGLAIASLICGILSLLGFLIFTGIPAVICGHIAKSRIKKSSGAITGSGMATAGLVTGYLSIALIPIIASLAALATPVILKAHQKSEMLQTSSAGKEIFVALIEFDEDHGKLPDQLIELETEGYIYDLEHLQPKSGKPWIYIPTQRSTAANHILLVSHQDNRQKRIVLRTDGSVTQMLNADYEAALAAQKNP